MGVGRAESDVGRRNAQLVRNPLLHATSHLARNGRNVERDDGRLGFAVTQDQRPNRRRLPNARDAALVAGGAVKAGHFDAQGRRDIDRALADLELIGVVGGLT